MIHRPRSLTVGQAYLGVAVYKMSFQSNNLLTPRPRPGYATAYSWLFTHTLQCIFGIIEQHCHGYLQVNLWLNLYYQLHEAMLFTQCGQTIMTLTNFN